MDVNENVVEDFIQKITRAKYDIDGLLLNEQSQGLGFSNLIYLHMRLEEFYKSVDDSKVNVFFIEEPESHMHPQMQNVFIRFLTKYYTEKKLQGLITTHSNEIARSVGLNSLRVIRQTEKSKSELFNLSKFRKSIENKKVKNVDKESEFLLQNFFDWFFEIGYSELIFADKVILYEGDTERLYIRKLLGMTEFASLRDNYIAFIQVGGAYAHNYLEILTMLKMKSLIITDLDYNNKHLINAPAGSGKTTNIRTRLKSICLKEPKSKILCITYTNRAADELKKDLDSANVTVSTIHSYINDLISPFYPLKEALDLYWEIFKEKIEARIKNEERDEHIDQSNQHYIEKHGDLNVDLVRENLRELSYGETPFTSLYSGKLSHDDLIMFANKLIKKYPVLLRKISDKYNYIFIDEYQDTSAYILDIFYDSRRN